MPAKPSLLEQALAETKSQLDALPKDKTVALVVKGSTAYGGSARIGLVARDPKGQWALASDLGYTKDKGVVAAGTLILTLD